MLFFTNFFSIAVLFSSLSLPPFSQQETTIIDLNIAHA
jgi:hypothetical protein